MATNEELCELAAQCWFLTGATASGKTTLGIKLAQELNGEIIALDSMTVYRGMDIGTAKPTLEQRAAVPHHLIDVCEPTELFSVSMYRELATQAIREILDRGRVAVFVGGTALYLKAMLRGLFQGPPADWDFRREVEQEVESTGLEALYKRLQVVDPVSAHKLQPTDQRRIIRALEVKRITGIPLSHWQQEFDVGRSADECKVFAIRHPRAKLHERIAERVHWMLRHGLIDEVKGLLERYGALHKTASQAVGYKEVIDYLADKLSLDELNERIVVRTRRFVRHQETWFRGMSECRMIDVPAENDSEQLVERIIELGKAAAPRQHRSV
ncbi:MAG TPA: tRNA (adenosine(37)-N6)-dimethylallyltransferase MiaA [Pirellulaceae bacterium]|nr:tRNA (adenosine(37)-N6)-dimethylallyltransferase MiaA [Pirellulaceae bacterium]HMO93753.1 tRNA (adenosine(37)-N6)-dimethylallyltransferase MiaA [Pirellulaceae bacterium]HMP69910.1 tRNA (adenosine(37)-N6)-dimethylallyltransferase MiaA [Pirellulaceae bacterium]